MCEILISIQLFIYTLWRRKEVPLQGVTFALSGGLTA